MRKPWFSVVAVTAAISIGACASGTETEGAPSDGTITGASTSDASSGAQQTSGSEDANAGLTPPSGGDDAGQQQTPPTTQDSGSPSETPDSALPTPPVDANPPPPVSDDSGAPPAIPATCPTGSPYSAEWLSAPSSASSCSTSADCGSSECCYVPVLFGISDPLAALCVQF